MLLVVQPRWCRCCLERRKALLAEGLARVYQIDQFTSEEALRRKQKAYVRGVVRGRAYALAHPLEESERLGCTDVESGVPELADMLLDARLSCIGLDEELATLMQKYSMDGDDFSCEMEIALIEIRGWQGYSGQA